MIMTKVHYLRRGKRQTACGRKAKVTAQDTRDPAKVTCLTCRYCITVWKLACNELAGE